MSNNFTALEANKVAKLAENTAGDRELKAILLLIKNRAENGYYGVSYIPEVLTKKEVKNRLEKLEYLVDVDGYSEVVRISWDVDTNNFRRGIS